MSSGISNELLVKVSNILKNEDDLNNIENIISNITKEKHLIDSQINIEQDRHLQQIHLMISDMHNANKNLQELKYTVEKLDDLRNDNLLNNSLNDFKVFDKAALVMKNIKLIEEVYNNISTFDTKQKIILQTLNNEILKDERGELQYSTGDELLIAHFELNKLRDLQDQMQIMSNKSKINETKILVDKLANQLNECVLKFNELLSIMVDSILDFVECENFGYLIKVIKIIQYEEREDLKVRLWNHLLEKKKINHGDINDDNIDNISDNRLTKVKRSRERGYKTIFEDLFQKTIEDKILDTLENNGISIFLGSEGSFYYQTISDFKIAIDRCFPVEWNFFPKILEWHQSSIRNFINNILDNDNYNNIKLAEILDLDYENRTQLKKLFKFKNEELKNIRLISEDKKKQLLNKSLQENISSTNKWIETALNKSIDKFESLNEEPSDRKEDRLSFQSAQDIMLILSSNTKSIRTLGDATILVQYFGFFANDIMRSFQEKWVRSLDKMTIKWINKDEEIKNIGYLPRYITNLSNDCLTLTDALERDFDNITEGLNDIHKHKLIELKHIATNHSIELGTYCLQKLSNLSIEDYKMIIIEIFNKSWYKSSTIIESILRIIDEEYIMPFIDFSYPELFISLFDFITDDFLLNYLKVLNYKRKFENKIVESLERDGHLIMDILGKHDEEGILENKMIIFDIIIEIISSKTEDEIIERWTIALSEIFDLPSDLLRILLECKKFDKSRISYIMGECEELCKKSMNENIDKEQSIFHKFHYSPIKK